MTIACAHMQTHLGRPGFAEEQFHTVRRNSEDVSVSVQPNQGISNNINTIDNSNIMFV